MKTAIQILLVTFCLTGLVSETQAQYPGTNLRGRVMSNGYYGQTPLTYANIDLWIYNSYYKKWQVVASTVTDAYGFYYFSGVKPNAYTIQVNKSKNYNINVVMIDYRYYQYQDLPIFYY